MDKFLIKRVQNTNESRTSSTSDASTAAHKRSRVEFDLNEIINDLGLRKKIEEYDVNVKYQVRREYVARGPCQPRNVISPKKLQANQMRSFKQAWYSGFDWLEYSVEKDAAFCFYCYLFKQQSSDFYHRNDAFTGVGFTDWKKATEKFHKHVGDVSSCHNNARRDYDDFRNQRQSVSHVLSTHSREIEIDYRVRLTASLKVFRLCILQGLAFRGHDVSSSSNNRGNFLEFLKFHGEENESLGRVINKNARGNNQMTSSKIQKELVRACAEETRKVIIDEIGDKKFSLLVDESRDASINEQMAVTVRFVNEKGYVIEIFLGVEHVTNTSAHCLKVALDDLFGRHGLSLSNLRGQGYDGAANMSGEFNGLNTLILNEHPFAFFVHCFAHQLRLVVVYVAKNTPSVTDFFNYVGMIVNVVGGSCKRHDALLQKNHENMLEKLESGDFITGQGQHQQTTLKRAGDTRWGSHHATLVRLVAMSDFVSYVLKIVHADGSSQEQRATTSGLIQKMEDFEFIFVLHLMLKVLGMTNGLSIVLQQKDQNIVNAMQMIETLKEMFQDLREDGWDAFMDEVRKFCILIDVQVPNMEDGILA